MSRDAYYELAAVSIVYHVGRQRTTCEVHAISASCASDVRAVVDKQPRRGASSDFGSSSGKLIEYTCVEVFFAKLKEGNLCGDRCFDQGKDPCEVGALRSCCLCRRSARY